MQAADPDPIVAHHRIGHRGGDRDCGIAGGGLETGPRQQLCEYRDGFDTIEDAQHNRQPRALLQQFIQALQDLLRATVALPGCAGVQPAQHQHLGKAPTPLTEGGARAVGEGRQQAQQQRRHFIGMRQQRRWRGAQRLQQLSGIQARRHDAAQPGIPAARREACGCDQKCARSHCETTVSSTSAARSLSVSTASANRRIAQQRLSAFTAYGAGSPPPDARG